MESSRKRPREKNEGFEIFSSTTIDNNSTGKSNTDAIVTAMEDANFTEDYAAKACADSTLGGKDDWFLPSKDELNELYKQKGLVSANYWSSSEVSSGEAWGQVLSGSDESQINFSKDVGGIISARAVRAF